MKKLKNLSALLLVIVIVSLLVACGSEIVDHATDRIEDRIESKTDHIEDKVENKVDHIENKVEFVISGHRHTHSVKTDDSQNNNNAVTDDKITAHQAEEIALKHADFTADEVVFDRTEYDADDRIPHYEIEFHKGYKEYSYDIHAVTGEILSFEIDD